MNKSIIIKSLLNGIASCLLIALIVSLKNGMAYTQALTASNTLIFSACAAVGSFFGFMIKAKRRSQF